MFFHEKLQNYWQKNGKVLTGKMAQNGMFWHESWL